MESNFTEMLDINPTYVGMNRIFKLYFSAALALTPRMWG